MGELKTLKDIEPELLFSGKEIRELEIRHTDMKKVGYIQHERDRKIKQEAFKWIKADNSNFYSRQGKDETILWIKNFFNITEEDCKNGI